MATPIYGLEGLGRVADIPGAIQGGEQFKLQQDAVEQQRRAENTQWLAGAAKYALDNWGQRGILESIRQEGERRGIPLQFDPSTVSKQSVIKVYNQAKAALGGTRFEDIEGPLPAGQRDTLTGEITPGRGAVPQPRVPASMQEYQLARAQGYPGSFLDFQKEVNLYRSTGRATGTAEVVPAGERVAAATRLVRGGQGAEALANIKKWNAKINEGVGPFGADGGPVEGRILAGIGAEAAQGLDQAVNDAFQHVMALTRIPGVGAQSDWEGRLQMIPLPSITQHPSIRQQAIDSLESLVNEITAVAERVIAGDTSGLMTPTEQPAQDKPTPTKRWNPETQRLEPI